MNKLVILFLIYGYITYLLFFNHTHPLMKWIDKCVKGDNAENDTRKAVTSNRNGMRRIK